MRAEVLCVSELTDKGREEILPPSKSLDGPSKRVDLMEESAFGSIREALATLTAPPGRVLVVRAMGSPDGRLLEVIVPEAPLKEGLTAFAGRILVLSLIISLTAAMLIYLLLILMVVRPIRRVTDAVIQFRSDPGSWTRRLGPTRRRDEIGRAQNALADMESAVSESFRQRDRLAQLGEAVAKINHDLRNSLATAQIASDALSTSDDPRVKRTMPRLERALERAIGLASETLRYGRSSTPVAELRPVALKETIDEAALEALGSDGTRLVFQNQLSVEATAMADPDHLYRIAANLIRNARQALDGPGTITVSGKGNRVEFSDSGPGLPERTRENLFKPFSVSSRKDGTGLGLALSRDLARAMGGDLVLLKTGPAGTVFRLSLPES
jgi:signal transduction histidine kinase